VDARRQSLEAKHAASRGKYLPAGPAQAARTPLESANYAPHSPQAEVYRLTLAGTRQHLRQLLPDGHPFAPPQPHTPIGPLHFSSWDVLSAIVGPISRSSATPQLCPQSTCTGGAPSPLRPTCARVNRAGTRRALRAAARPPLSAPQCTSGALKEPEHLLRAATIG